MHIVQFVFSQVMAVIMKERELRIKLYTILQILSLILFEKTLLDQQFMKKYCTTEEGVMSNQLDLFH